MADGEQRDTSGEHFLRAANRASMWLEQEALSSGRIRPPQLINPEDEEEMPNQQLPEAAVALTRMVDFKIPLPWLLSGFIAGVGVLVMQYYQLQQVRESMQEVQITLKATTATLSQISSKQTLSDYRLDKLEAHDMKAGK